VTTEKSQDKPPEEPDFHKEVDRLIKEIAKNNEMSAPAWIHLIIMLREPLLMHKFPGQEQLGAVVLEEIFDQAFNRVMKKADQYEARNGPASGFKWIKAITRNLFLNALRIQKQQAAFFEKEVRHLREKEKGITTRSLENKIEKRLTFNEFVNTLTGKYQRDVINLLAKGYKKKEIAAQLQVAPSRISQILQGVKKELLIFYPELAREIEINIEKEA